MPDVAFFAVQPNKCVSMRKSRVSELNDAAKIEKRAQEMLESHPHFRGRQRWVQCRCSNGRLYLTGNVPSYFLKQLAQEAVRDLEDVDLVVNQIIVTGRVWQAD